MGESKNRQSEYRRTEDREQTEGKDSDKIGPPSHPEADPPLADKTACLICLRVNGQADPHKRRSLVMNGETISHYKILEKLGEGGMSVVLE